MSYPTCGNKSGLLQTIQNSLLALNPTTQQFSSDFSLLALNSRYLLKNVLDKEVITGKFLIQRIISYSWKNLDLKIGSQLPPYWLVNTLSTPYRFYKLRYHIKKQYSGSHKVKWLENRANNTLESQQLNWPSSLNPNHFRCEPGVNGRRPLRG